MPAASISCSASHEAKWRFTSLPDFGNIVRAATVLAVSLLVLDYVLVSPVLYGAFFFGKITIVLYWFLQIAFLGGPRIAYRYFRYVRTRHHAREGRAVPTLVLGRAADAEVLLRAIESGAASKVRPVGILSPSLADRGQSIRGIPVVGGLDDLELVVKDVEGARRARVAADLHASALVPEVAPEAILMQARRLGLQTSRLPSLDEGGEALQLAPVAVEDLLLRPSVKIDYGRLEHFIRGKSIVVTGGGGSIGAEICDRMIAFGAARLLVVEHSEVALHTVLEALRAKAGNAEIDGRIADVRDRERIFGDLRRLQAGHRVPRGGAQARAAARARLGRGRQDQRVRLGQCRRCGRGGRRRRHGDDLDRQGDRAGVGARRDQALRRDVLPGARRRLRAPQSPPADAADRGALRQCARLERLGGAEVQGADRGSAGR